MESAAVAKKTDGHVVVGGLRLSREPSMPDFHMIFPKLLYSFVLRFPSSTFKGNVLSS